MPEFFAEHVPSGLDEFTTGYLECAEWLARCCDSPDRSDDSLTHDERSKIRGFTRKAIAAAKQDCRDFQDMCSDLLIQYEQETGRDMRCAGHDFWLTRNRHGAGFWDRGNAPCLRELSDHAHGYCECNCELYRNRLELA